MITLLIGIVVAVVGFFFTVILINIPLFRFDEGSVFAWGIYLCIVMVACTRAILSKLNKNDGGDNNGKIEP